jgi:hypothetical protein
MTSKKPLTLENEMAAIAPDAAPLSVAERMRHVRVYVLTALFALLALVGVALTVGHSLNYATALKDERLVRVSAESVQLLDGLTWASYHAALLLTHHSVSGGAALAGTVAASDAVPAKRSDRGQFDSPFDLDGADVKSKKTNPERLVTAIVKAHMAIAVATAELATRLDLVVTAVDIKGKLATAKTSADGAVALGKTRLAVYLTAAPAMSAAARLAYSDEIVAAYAAALRDAESLAWAVIAALDETDAASAESVATMCLWMREAAVVRSAGAIEAAAAVTVAFDRPSTQRWQELASDPVDLLFTQGCASQVAAAALPSASPLLTSLHASIASYAATDGNRATLRAPSGLTASALPFTVSDVAAADTPFFARVLALRADVLDAAVAKAATNSNEQLAAVILSCIAIITAVAAAAIVSVVGNAHVVATTAVQRLHGRVDEVSAVADLSSNRQEIVTGLVADTATANDAAGAADVAAGDGTAVEMQELKPAAANSLKDRVVQFSAQFSALIAKVRPHLPQVCFGDLKVANLGAQATQESNGVKIAAMDQAVHDLLSRELRTEKKLVAVSGAVMTLNVCGVVSAAALARLAAAPTDGALGEVCRASNILLEMIQMQVNGTGGVILGFTGDTVVSIWNLTGTTALYHSQAVRAALLIVAKLKEIKAGTYVDPANKNAAAAAAAAAGQLQKKKKRHHANATEIDRAVHQWMLHQYVSIGISHGPMVAGTMVLTSRDDGGGGDKASGLTLRDGARGARDRVDSVRSSSFEVIGPPIAVSRKLELLNARHRTSIIVSSEIADVIADDHTSPLAQEQYGTLPIAIVNYQTEVARSTAFEKRKVDDSGAEKVVDATNEDDKKKDEEKAKGLAQGVARTTAYAVFTSPKSEAQRAWTALFSNLMGHSRRGTMTDARKDFNGFVEKHGMGPMVLPLDGSDAPAEDATLTAWKEDLPAGKFEGMGVEN